MERIEHLPSPSAFDTGPDDPSVYERNVENFIGTVRVPIGLAGPLTIDGGAAHGAYYVPLATTEAALVASYSRGAQLITRAGGCTARVLDARMRRAPVFVFDGLRETMLAAAWVRANTAQLRIAAEATSRHAKLLEIETAIEGNHLYLDCAYATARGTLARPATRTPAARHGRSIAP
jgi:hydroxymethylglutaryl-CoA reductase (NADPH)